MAVGWLTIPLSSELGMPFWSSMVAVWAPGLQAQSVVFLKLSKVISELSPLMDFPAQVTVLAFLDFLFAEFLRLHNHRGQSF